MHPIERRGQSAMTLVELLVAMSIVGIAGAGIAGLFLLYSMTTTRVAHKVDNVNQARRVVERVCRDVRMSRNLGDAFGELQDLEGSDPPLQVSKGSAKFPSEENPFYGDGEEPPSSFGGWPSSLWPTRPYELGSDCLILQIPVIHPDEDIRAGTELLASDVQYKGYPRARFGAADDDDRYEKANVDTVIYQLISDPDNTGQYMLEVAGFPGNPTNLRLRSNPVNGTGARVGTVLKGIVGPLDPVTKKPKVFQYLLRTDSTGTPKDSLDEDEIANATGVIINLEILRQETGANNPSVIPLRTETYLRNNVLAY